MFDTTLNTLDRFIHKIPEQKEYSKADQEFLVSTNIYGRFKKDDILKCLGVYKDRGFNMFIFTITKEYKVVCEIYLEHYDDDFTQFIREFLMITDSLYFFEICALDQGGFEYFWKSLTFSFVNEDSEGKLKSIHFMPYSPKEIICHSFDNVAYEIMLPFLEDVQNWLPKITCVFEHFDFKDKCRLELLLNASKETRVKFFDCKIYLSLCINASYLKPNDLFLYVSKCDFYDIDLSDKSSQINDIKNLFLESSFKPYKLLLKLRGTKFTINCSDILRLARMKTSLYKHILFNLRTTLKAFKIIDRNKILLNFMLQNIVINLPKNNQTDLTDWTNRFASAYLKLRRGAMIYPMNSEEIFGRVFKANKTPLPLSSLNMSGCSCEIKESNLSPCDFTAILNLTGLLNKLSIINSKVTVIRNRMFYNFLDHVNTNLKILIIENVEFFVTNNIISSDQKEEFDINYFLNLYNINLKSYLLYYILDKTKLLYSLQQIHIKQDEDKV